MSPSQRLHLPVVALGASAGGLAALRELFRHTPDDTGAAFVVVMHLDPGRESHLPDLLQLDTRMPVTQVGGEAGGDEPLAADHIYVIPPNCNLSAIDTHLRLSPLEPDRRQRAPIDHFFRTLAESHGGHAIAVVLTGTGSDGTVGLKLMKEKGGLTIAQDPSQAEYDGMPRSAIATGQVDVVLPLERIPEQIVRYLRTTPQVRATEDPSGEEREALERVLAQVQAQTGHDYNQYKTGTIGRRIRRRMQIYGIASLADYARFLHDNRSEREALDRDLLINVTNFFRDPPAWEALERKVIPRLFHGRGSGDQVRVWSIGCATGEEAFSLAMLLHEHAATLPSPPAVQVFASDIHPPALAHARDGLYSEAIVNDVSEARLERHFVQDSGGGYRIRKGVRERVLFAPHDIMRDPPFSRIDLVVCRNVLIYLRREVQRQVFELLHYALKPGGFLFLGSSEAVEGGDLFRPLDKHHALYERQKVGSAQRQLPQLPIQRAVPLSAMAAVPGDSRPLSYGALHQRIVEQYAPPSVLVSREHDILHISETATRYLSMTGGEPTTNLLKCVRPELRIELRSALYAALEQGRSTHTQPVLLRIEGEARQVALWVRPPHDRELQGFALVVFEESDPPASLREGAPSAGASAVQRLEEELDATRQRLQAVIEEYETGQEEMRASNEELQSINEELKSTTEELETSKEELQSINEELLTVNQENQNKVEELSQLTNDLQNLLAATDIATLFLDRELRIKRFTPRVHDLLNVLATDLGRPLSHVTHRLDYDGILDDAKRVLETLTPSQRQVGGDGGHWYLMRMRPYRTLEDRIEGVVITFVEITELTDAKRALEALTDQLEARVRERTQQVRQLASDLSIAEQRERSRIAGFLHDDVQQLLYALQVRVGMLLEQRDAEQVWEQLGGAQELLKHAIATTRALAVSMSPPVLQEEGLAEALQWLVLQMRDVHGLEVDADLRLAKRSPMSEGRRVMLFHSVRELLFNVVKHADRERARLDAFDANGLVTLRISDEGTGFDVNAALARGDSGFGLHNIRERLQLFGGSLEIDSHPGGGTRVTIAVPAED